MPELHHQGSSSDILSTNSGACGQDNSVTSLASSFKGKVKIEEKHGHNNENQPDQKKEVKVEIGGKTKSTGGKNSKKNQPSANMDLIQREITRAKEGAKQRLNFQKTNMTSLPASIKDVLTLTELYLNSNRLATLPNEIGKKKHDIFRLSVQIIVTYVPEWLASYLLRAATVEQKKIVKVEFR